MKVSGTHLRPAQRVKKVSKQECHCEEPPKRRRRGNPHPLKPAVLGALSEKMKHFGERIATPVCALVRNDRFFDSLSGTYLRPAFVLYNLKYFD